MPRKNPLLGAKHGGRVLGFRAVFETDGKWIVGSSPDLPGAFSQERTLSKARARLVDAARELLELRPELAKKLKPAPAGVHEVLAVKLR